MAVLGFFFPLIGFILWLVWKDEKPLKAKSAGQGALIGLIAGIVLGIITAILSIIFVETILSHTGDFAEMAELIERMLPEEFR